MRTIGQVGGLIIAVGAFWSAYVTPAISMFAPFSYFIVAATVLVVLAILAAVLTVLRKTMRRQ